MSMGIFRNSIVVVVSTIVAVFAVELLLRWFIVEGIPDEDPYLGRVMMPGGDWDANGFRNPVALDEAKIIAIGDSQTMGDNAKSEEAWPKVLAQVASTSVYSMAVGGYGPVQYAYLVERAILLRPKLVIIGLYLGNDLLDAKRMAYGAEKWKQLREPNYRDEINNIHDPYEDIRLMLGSGAKPDSWSLKILTIRTWVRNHSRLYALLGNTTRSLREKIGIADTFEEKQQKIGELANERPDIAFVYASTSPLSTTLSANYRDDAIDLGFRETKEGLRITKDRLRYASDFAKRADSSLVILVIPTKEKVYLEFMKSTGEAIPEAFLEYARKEEELERTLLEFCSTENLLCHFALPDMVNVMRVGSMLYGVTMDGHPVSLGYRTIGESVFNYLKENHLLP